MQYEPSNDGAVAAPVGTKNSVENNGSIIPLSYDGSLGRVYGIWLLNLILTIVTLGIYIFWGKTRMRRYVAGGFKLLGDRFAYTGTGKELFLGFLKVMPFIIVLYAPLVLYSPEVYPITNLLFVVYYFLFLVAIYAALRYRLSRTTWRGIRGRLTGSAFKYGAIGMGVGILNVLTLGIFIAKGDQILMRYKMSNVWFGNTQGVFIGTTGQLWKSHLITLVLALPTLGLSRVWYAATVFRFQLNNFSVGGIKFNADAQGWDLFGLFLGNFLIVIFTLGFGTPIVIQRNMKYMVRFVSLSGDINAAAEKIYQSQEDLKNSGEGLDGALGVDSGLF
ncbi:MAG: DUF898 family protein [Rhodospirillaceae bacterium]